MIKQRQLWEGKFGDDYTTRNIITDENLAARRNFWGNILNCTVNNGLIPTSILEFGAGNGINILALNDLLQAFSPTFNVVEINDKAISTLASHDIVKGIYKNLDSIDSYSHSLVFTSGVLIHIHPDELLKTMTQLYRISNKYIVCAEYFRPEPEIIKYRGEKEALFVRDFGAMYLDNFPLRCLVCGFAWKKITGLDNLTFQLFEKTQ